MERIEQEIHHEPTSFLRKYLFSTDHKMITKQFLWYGFFFLLVGGLMALLIRWVLAYPNEPFPFLGNLFYGDNQGLVSPQEYASLFTLHGTIMIFYAITPLLIGAFGNYCIPLMIGARDMAFPTLNMLSFWFMVISGLFLLSSFFLPLGPAAAGWTSYPTLSTLIGSPGHGQTFWCVAIFFLGIASTMGAINYITTVIAYRAPGMTYFRMPITVWGLLLTAILNVIFLPVLAAGILLLIFDRLFGTTFFLAGAGAISGSGDPILYQHVFWIFGHPEVYILILPVWGIVSDLLSFFARKPAFAAKTTVLAMSSVTILSTLVYGHHMFTTQMSPLLTQSFMTLTLTISIPSTVLFANWILTLWGGSLRFTVPMLFAMSVVFVFGVGGLTGLYLGAISTDLYLHDTYFVVGHFHYTMAASVLMGMFAGFYFWFPKIYGKMMNVFLGKIHFWGTFLTLNVVFTVMMLMGFAGMHRRIFNPFVYEFLVKLIPLNTFTTTAALLLGLFQVPFVMNLFYSLFKGNQASKNPWEVGTLEWTIDSPPPYHNYDPIPVVQCGPHELGREGRELIYQTEKI